MKRLEGKRGNTFSFLEQLLSTGFLLGQPPQLLDVMKCRKKTPGLII